jgi:hypothetical protein
LALPETRERLFDKCWFAALKGHTKNRHGREEAVSQRQIQTIEHKRRTV